jgi:hypothetical protein
MRTTDMGRDIQVIRDVLHKRLGWSHEKIDNTTIGEAVEAWEGIVRDPGNAGEIVRKSLSDWRTTKQAAPTRPAAKPATAKPAAKQAASTKPVVRPVVKQVAPTPAPSTIMAKAAGRVQDAILSVLPEPVRLAIAVREKVERQVATPEFKAQIADQIATAIEATANRERIRQGLESIKDSIAQIKAANSQYEPGGRLSGTSEAYSRKYGAVNPHAHGTADWHIFEHARKSQRGQR